MVKPQLEFFFPFLSLLYPFLSSDSLSSDHFVEGRDLGNRPAFEIAPKDPVVMVSVGGGKVFPMPLLILTGL